MKETPITFSAEMVRAILDGHKTQTRLVVEPQPEDTTNCPYLVGIGENRKARVCPYGKPGDCLKVEGSYVTLEILKVWIERLRDISEQGAKAEGIAREAGWWKNYDPEAHWRYWESPIQSFRTLWGSLYADLPGCSWADNPWVWVIEFKRLGMGKK